VGGRLLSCAQNGKPGFYEPVPHVVIKLFSCSNLKMEISFNAMTDRYAFITPFVASGTKNGILKTFRYILRGAGVPFNES
jgi:hypothetical protein